MSMFLDREAHAKLLWLAKNQELTTYIQKLVNEVDQLGERVEHAYQEKVEAERKLLFEGWESDSLRSRLEQESKWRREQIAEASQEAAAAHAKYRKISSERFALERK